MFKIYLQIASKVLKKLKNIVLKQNKFKMEWLKNVTIILNTNKNQADFYS